MTTDPLAGKRVVITRPRAQAGELADLLRARGAEPVLLSTIEIVPPRDTGPLDDALRRLPDYDWAVFTSANAVEQVWARLAALGIAPHFTRVAAIGPATAEALRARGVEPDVIPAKHIAEALAEGLIQAADLRGARVLLPQSNLARPVLRELLAAAGAQVDAVTAYETVRPEGGVTVLGPFDAITFTSSSSAQNFAALLDDPLAAIGGALVAVIGPVTARTVRDLGWPVHAVAEPHTVEGLVAALAAAFERKLAV